MSIYKMSKIVLALLLAGSLSSAARATDYLIKEEEDNKSFKNITYEGHVGAWAKGISFIECSFKNPDKYAGNGGGINCGDDGYKTSIVIISGCTFSGNSSEQGGAIYNSKTASIGSIINSYFTNNAADYMGGAIYNTGSIEEIYDCHFTGNTVTSQEEYVGVGGAIMNAMAARIERISNSEFTQNKAATAGGAIYNDYWGEIGSIENCTFNANESVRGGAIYNNKGELQGESFSGTTTIVSISGSTFTGNIASLYGGGIYNNNGAVIGSITDSKFIENGANAGNGGAIENAWGESAIGNISGCTFEGNKAIKDESNTVNITGVGAAIYNEGIIGSASYTDSDGETVTVTGGISDCTFKSNIASESGGAIYNRYNDTMEVATTAKISYISGSYFEANQANRGGAIYNDINSSIGSITNSTFDSNIANLYGGAIYNNEGGDIGSIDTVKFVKNQANKDGDTGGNGGAIENAWHLSTIGEITGSYFEENTAAGHGAAIYNEGMIGYDTDGSTVTGGISKSTFKENTADGDGGAIYNATGVDSANGNATTYSKISSIEDCYFDGNTATSGSGGAIYNAAGCTMGTITNTSFVNNTAGEKGGAIYTTSALSIAADGSKDGGDVIISGNTAGSDDNAIYMAKDADGKVGNLTFTLSNKGTITLEDNIRAEEGEEYSVKISGDSTETTFYLLNDIYDGDVSIGNTTLSTIDGEVHSYNDVYNTEISGKYYGMKTFTLTDNINMVADVDLAEEEMDRIVTTDKTTEGYTDGYNVGSNKLNVSGMNLLSDTEKDKVAVYFAEEGLMKNVTAGVSKVPGSNQLEAFTPMYEYKVYYLYDDNGTITYGNNTYNASDSELINDVGGYFVFTKSGFNPAVMAPAVAEAGAYNAFGMVFDYNFEHSDYYMKLPEDVRLAMSEERQQAKNAPKENDPTRSAYYNQHELTYRGAWSRSFFSNESVDYGGGWDSRDKYYGAMFGFDTDMKFHDNGWANVTTGYVGTMGIRQQFSGGHIKQHGGFVGVTESFYKKNFYNAWTIAAGFTKAHEHTMYGHDKDRIDEYGIATRLGWNIRLGDDEKFTLLPTFTASYSYIHPEDFTNAANVHIAGSGFRAVQLNPNVKLIWNRDDGWQPYLTLGEVWTVADSIHLRANGEKLPELDLDPYTEYGIGVQKRWAYERDAYLQLLGHSHGRDGFLVNAGIRWNF